MSVLLWASVCWCVWAWLAPPRQRFRRTAPQRTADIVDLLALSARRGASFHESLDRCVRYVTTTDSQILAPLVSALDLGVSVRGAVDLATLDPSDPLAVALEALADAADRGGSLVDELDRVGADVRRLESLDVATRARRMSVWLTAPLVLCHLPAFLLVAVAPALLPALTA
ncbi:MAG: hypothetical protein GY708_12930 [Actinomycetia bacterium]|nr:hypothetical protein [Actinomycetes bacterium]MCP4961568.1 hypothetical protein [Actinomycetes bacterium]